MTRSRCGGAVAARGRATGPAVADHLAAAEDHFLAVDGVVLLDLDDQFGVGQADAVAGGGAVVPGVGRRGTA